jgi:orotate phosphoribosyltransferase
MEALHANVARRIYQTSSITGQFKLRSGITSSEYFDKYLFESDPRLLRDIADLMCAHIPAGIDTIAGLELGGVPIAVVLSQATGIPTLFVRKQAKTYGTCKLAEGGGVAGRKIVIVEDVVTTGGQIIESARQLQDMGGKIIRVTCVVDREQGGVENLAKHGFELKPLFTATELRAAAV